MSFVNPAVLAGLGLMMVPVLLHLLMRAKPKKVTFPALQLIQSRRKTNSRRMRLRHLGLLALRMGTLALFVIAVARPSLPPANYRPRPGEAVWAITITAVIGIVYWQLARFWKRRTLTAHELRYRTTLLRCGSLLGWLVLFALFAVWPYQQRIAAEIAQPLPDVAESLPVAAVFLFDTSTSMKYQLENETRLEVAQRIATEHLARLPRGSRVAVMNTSELAETPLVADLSSSQARIENLTATDSVVPLTQCLDAAVQLLESHAEDMESEAGADRGGETFLYEIYTFTDMARSAWPDRPSERLVERIERNEWLHVYLVDTGVTDARNLGLARLRVSDEHPASTSELFVTAEIVGPRSQDLNSVELLLPNDQGELIKRDQKLIPPAEAGSAVTEAIETQFVVRNLPDGLNQGEVRITSPDPLLDDNRAYFTIDVGQPVRVLVVADRAADAKYWSGALAPPELVQLQRAPYTVHFMTPQAATDEASLAGYDLISLINVRKPSDRLWNSLFEYARGGGGLFVTAGSADLDVRSYLSPVAQKVLPAKLLGSIRFREATYLDIPNTAIHPLFRVFDELGGIGELSLAEIRRCWSVEPLEQARVICSYTNGLATPALIERPVGDGRSLMLTTALDTGDWSDLVRSRWSFVALCDQIAEYLVTAAHAPRNFKAGTRVVLPVEPTNQDRSYRLRRPGFEQTRGQIAAHQSSLVLDDCRQAGHYQLIVGSGDTAEVIGFSANRPPGESDLTRLTAEDLTEYLGAERFTVASALTELDRTVRQRRLGQEVYPWVLALLVMLFCGEHLVANRFYAQPVSDENEAEAEQAAKKPVDSEHTGPSPSSPLATQGSA